MRSTPTSWRPFQICHHAGVQPYLKSRSVADATARIFGAAGIASVWLRGQTLQLLGESCDVIDAVDADAAERVQLTRTPEPVLRRRRAEMAGELDRVDDTRVVLAGGIAEEVDRHAERLLQLDPGAVHLAPDLGVVEPGQIRMRERVGIDLPARREQLANAPDRQGQRRAE